MLVAEGGDFTPRGDFATPVQLALSFNGKEFTGRLPQLQLGGNLLTMFNEAYRGVSTDRFTPLASDRYLVLDLSVAKI